MNEKSELTREIEDYLVNVLESQEYASIDYLLLSIRKNYLHYLSGARLKQFEIPEYLKELVNVVQDMNEKFPQKAQEIMNERFGHDTLISLATINGDFPDVRTVNTYYENGAFYVITYALSNKMKQIEINPNVGISGDWFTAHGKGVSMGWFCKEENKVIAEKLKKAFSEWIDNGHNNFDDENTIILCIQLTDGVLFSHGTRYDIDFEG